MRPNSFGVGGVHWGVRSEGFDYEFLLGGSRRGRGGIAVRGGHDLFVVDQYINNKRNGREEGLDWIASSWKVEGGRTEDTVTTP